MARGGPGKEQIKQIIKEDKMRESIHKYFKLGVVQNMAYPSPAGDPNRNLLESIRKIACDDTFDAIEITWIGDSQLRGQVKRMLEASHLTVCYAAQPRLLSTGLNVNHLDEAERQKAEDVLIESLDEAEQLGSKGIAFLSGKWRPETREESYSQLLKTTRHLCDRAKAKNMSVELEVFDFDIAKASLIGPAPLAARLAADIRQTHNNFGLLIDLSHIPLTYETSEFVVRTLRPYVTHFHIGNAVIEPGMEAFGDTHPRFGFPRSPNDTAQVVEFLRLMKAEGFFDSGNPPVLSFEVKPWGDERPELVVAGAKRVLNRAWAMLEENV